MAGGCTSRRTGRRVTRLLRSAVALGLVVSALPAFVRPADAILVCQRKKKVVLRGDNCARKETLVVDLGTITARGNDLTQRGTQIDAAKAQLGFTCPADPSRTLVLSKFAGPVRDGSVVNERPGGGCRTLDGNQTACVAAFQNGDPFTNRRIPQALPCFYTRGKCLPCMPRAEGRAQACRNSCFPPPVCADATRTVFAGGPGEDSCRSFTTQVDCEKAWHVAGIERPPSAASCYWTGSACNGCGPRHRNAADCTNSCAPGSTHPSCKDPVRVTFAGGPRQDACTVYNGNQATCETAFHEGADGIAATCWFEASSTNCRGCGLRHELAGHCINTCL